MLDDVLSALTDSVSGLRKAAEVVDDAGTGQALRAMAERHACVGEVRGLGVFWAIELVADQATRAPVGAAVIGRAKKEMLARGLLPFAADNRIHAVPPCVVTDDEVAQALSIYDDVLTLLDEEL